MSGKDEMNMCVETCCSDAQEMMCGQNPVQEDAQPQRLAELNFYIDLQLFADGPAGERTEKPTPYKRRKAREKGQVAKSQELNTAVVIFFFTLLSGVVVPYFFHSSYVFMKSYFANINDMLKHIQYGFIFNDMTVALFKMALPIMILVLLLSVVSNVAQIGFLFTAYPLRFDLNRINPIMGFKRLFSMRSFFEFLKSLFKVGVIGLIMYLNLKNKVPLFVDLMDMDINQSLVVVAKLLYKMLVHISIFLVFLGIMDLLYQRYEHEKSLKMSVKELRDELKEHEGDPYVKAEITRRMQRMLMNRRRMKQKMQEATFVITNPTHFAVALRYEADVDDAPIILLKGEDAKARLIKKLAYELDVPVIENKPLARALYYEGEEGQPAPERFWYALAIIVTQVYAMQGRTMNRI